MFPKIITFCQFTYIFGKYPPKAGKSTNAWMITTGSNVGVMKAVGNAVSEGQSFLWDNDRITHTLRLIGIGPWGYVKDRKNLESDGNVSTVTNFVFYSNLRLHVTQFHLLMHERYCFIL